MTYVEMGWFVLLAWGSHFASDHVVGLLAVCTSCLVVIGAGAQTMLPTLRFAVSGLASTARVTLFAPDARVSSPIVLACMATVGLGILLAHWLLLSAQATARRRADAMAVATDGTTFPQEVTLTTLEDGGIICVLRDITARKRYEQQLVEAKDEAEEASRMKSVFLTNMSHEIRTPLTSIIGFAEVIEEEPADDPAPRFASLIEKSGRRLLETIDGVLNFSKLEAGETELTPESVDLAARAEAMAEQFAPQAGAAEVDLHVDTDRAPVRAWIDDGAVRIALRSLVSNATKYTETGDEV